MMRQLERQTEKALEQVAEKGYVIKRFGDSLDEPIAAFSGKVRVGDDVFKCETALNLNSGDIPGGTRAEFTTYIHGGRQGENVEHWNRTIENLNYDLPGKLVQDYTDGSNDVLYVTSEAASKLDGDLVIENIHHHAQTKAKLKPHLEYLDKQLRLEPHKNLTDSEQFAANYVNSIRKLPTAAQIRYISENI